MLFNVLSVILFFIIIYIAAAFGLAILAKKEHLKKKLEQDFDYKKFADENFKMCIAWSIIFTLVFMWVMSLQNWWR